MNFKILTIGISIAGSMALAGAARAEDPVSLGQFDDWEAFTYRAEGAPVCYVFSAPKKIESDKKIAKRDEVYFMVTHVPGRKVKGQISTIIGYPFKEASIVVLKVDGVPFDLYTIGDAAWAATADIEQGIVKVMKASKSFTLTGISWKGTQTTDTYSLTGFNKALDKIDASCK